MTHVRLEVLTAETASINVLLYVMLCSPVQVCRYFGDCLLSEGRRKMVRIFNVFPVLIPASFFFVGPVSRLGLNIASLFCFRKGISTRVRDRFTEARRMSA